MIAAFLKSYFGNVDFPIQQIEHLTPSDIRGYIGQRFYNHRKHMALVSALFKYVDKEYRWHGMPVFKKPTGVLGQQKSKLMSAFWNWDLDFFPDGDVETFITAFMFIRDYPENKSDYIYVDNYINLRWMTVDQWDVWLKDDGYPDGRKIAYIANVISGIGKCSESISIAADAEYKKFLSIVENGFSEVDPFRLIKLFNQDLRKYDKTRK